MPFQKNKNKINGSFSNPYREKPKNISSNCNKKSYRNHSNKSFKKLTEKEKKSVWFLSTINRLKHKAKILSDLRFITNEILTNGCYHEKNIEEQFKKFERVNIDKNEQELIVRAWDLKGELAKSLMSDLEVFLNDCEKELKEN